VHAKMIMFDYHALEVMAGAAPSAGVHLGDRSRSLGGLDPLVKFTGTCSPFELLERGR